MITFEVLYILIQDL